MSAIRDPAAVAGLLDGLRDVDLNVRSQSAMALGMSDPVAIPRLVDALAYDVDGSVRAESATALGAIGDPAAAPRLLDALTRDVDWSVRTASANALSVIRASAARGEMNRSVDPGAG